MPPSSPHREQAFAFEPGRYPAAPGCYLMLDAAGAVLYVGKAKHLRRRLATHFRTRPPGERRARLLASVADVEVILTRNETEALVLEHNLIKHHRPPGNRALVADDDGYFSIALTAEALPRLVPYREHRVNKALDRGGTAPRTARRFGPYVSRRFRDTLLELATDQFRLRTCAPLPATVCLRYHLGTCGGVCEDRASATEYAAAAREATAFLDRRHPALLRQLRRRMAEHAARLEFERAGQLKRYVTSLEGALEPQAVERDVRHDQDVLHFGAEGVLIMHVRRGKVQGFSWRALEIERGESPSASESCDRFLLARYGRESPRELIANRIADRTGVETALTAANGYPVRISVPRHGGHDGGRQEGHHGRGASALLLLCALNYAHRAAQRSPDRP